MVCLFVRHITFFITRQANFFDFNLSNAPKTACLAFNVKKSI